MYMHAPIIFLPGKSVVTSRYLKRYSPFFCSLASLLSSLSSSQKATLVAFVFSKGYTGDNLPDPYHIAFGLCVLKSKLDLVFRLQKRINKVRP